RVPAPRGHPPPSPHRGAPAGVQLPNAGLDRRAADARRGGRLDRGRPAADRAGPARLTLDGLPRRRPSEVAARCLGPLDGLEQRLEVAGAEAGRALTLDDLEEDGGSVA